MELEFDNRNLLEFYTEGQSRKYKGLSSQVLKKFVMCIDTLRAANNIYDLWKSKSLRFEKLQGFKDRFSVRLDRKWRLEFTIDFEDVQKTRGTVFIKELSSHYGD